MARLAKALTPLEISRIKDPGYHAVGTVAGLHLCVKNSGARSWILRVLVGGKRREIGLGGYPAVSVAGAWEAARVSRNKIKSGIDPVAEKIAAKSALAAAVASVLTFQKAAEKYIAQNEAGWKNAKHAAQWQSSLTAYAYPKIGSLQVSHVETSHVVGILEPIWNTKTETASRVRGRIESILDWARVRGYRTGENPARWKGHLDQILPARNKVQKVVHHSALDYREVSELMTSLRQVDGIGARALEFAILTATRSNEVRGATWTEIDAIAKTWVVPAERMKAGREHRIPLSTEVLHLLENLPRIAGTDLVFPNNKETKLSDMALTAVIRRMDEACATAGKAGWKDRTGKIITAHGFRSTFRDWAGETTAFPREVIEHALAHQLKDKAEAAYQRGTLFDKRRRLMDEWVKHCLTPSSTAEVTPIRGAA